MSESDKPMTDEDILAASVAMLNARNISQEKIAELLGISSQSKVSRLLAISRDFLEFEPRPVWKRLPPTEDEDLRIQAATFPDREKFEKAIRKLARSRGLVEPTSITVVHASDDRKNNEFGRRAAGQAAKLIEQSRYCGVAWGTTMKSLIDGLKSQQARTDLTFVPIAGQPLNSHEPGSSPSALAKNLSRVFGIESDNQLSLHGVPARIPKDMAADEDTIRDFIEHCDHYCKIFGTRRKPEDGLMNNVDMILSGIGDAVSSRDDPWYIDIEKMEGGELLGKIAQGNIGGIWLPMDRENDDHIRAVKEINDRSLGITDSQLEACADGARNGDATGVVVLAKEPQKADIFLSTVGLVNHYILSKALVDKVFERLEKSGQIQSG